MDAERARELLNAERARIESALGSLNARLATVKVYAGLAHDAATLDTDEFLRIKNVKGYGFLGQLPRYRS